MFAARVLHQAGFSVAAHAAQFDIDDPARFQFNGRERVSRVVNAFIQTDCGLNLRLQFRMSMDIVPAQWLFHHQQVKFI